MKKKSLSVKKKIHKNFISFLSDKKVRKTYKNFESVLNQLKFKNNVCIALSGGPDSLSLLYLLQCYKFSKSIKIYTYIVDHRLRYNSSKEAQKIKSKLKKFNIGVKILKWTGKKPSSNIQSEARKKRYFLISKQCKKDNVDTIFMAHHENDLYENFLIRLLRGSGLKGMVSFNSSISEYSDSIRIIRPLLNVKKDELIYISKKIFNFYIEDPSNNNDDFKRVRLRKLIIELKKEGLDFNKLRLSMNNLTQSNNAINFYVNLNIKNNVRKIKKNSAYILGKYFFKCPDEVVFRSLSSLLKKVSGKYYNPRGKSVLRLLDELMNLKYKKLTLSGCIIEKFNNSVIIYKENVKNS